MLEGSYIFLNQMLDKVTLAEILTDLTIVMFCVNDITITFTSTDREK